MASVFDKWDEAIDTEGLKKDIEDAANGKTGEYKEVPHGQYEVSVKQMELKASKKGDPMVSIWFEILEGDCKGQLIFYNQVILQGFQIHQANLMLRSLVSECLEAPEVEFEKYAQYSELILDIHEIISDNFEYLLTYGANKKGYNTYKIDEVFVLED